MLRLLLRLLQPSWLGITIYIVLIASVYFINSFELGLSLLTQDEQASASVFELLRQRIDDGIGSVDQIPHINTIFTFLLWAVAGSVIYVIVSAFLGAFTDAGFMYSAEMKYAHDSAYKDGDFVKTFSLRMVLHLLFFVVFFAYLLLFLQIVFPYFLQLFDQFLQNLTSIPSIIGFVVSLVGNLIGLHLVVVFLRLAMLRDRLFRSV